MNAKKKLKLVVLSGAGISAESGLSTFRGSGGLWEGYRIEEVASLEGWERNPEKVLNFYNARRQNVKGVKPNAAHLKIAQLERSIDVEVITQNIDNLHEQAGSTSVLHLHGEITKACSSNNKKHIHDIGYRDIELGETCKEGYQLRPFIVWFGEEVPLLEVAARKMMEADFVLIIGTSLEVYPAAGLIGFSSDRASIYIIDPALEAYKLQGLKNSVHIKEKASIGIEIFEKELKKRANIL